MVKYQVMATRYTYVDAFIEAKDAEDAIAKAQAEGVKWVTVGGDFEIHEDCVYEETDNG